LEKNIPAANTLGLKQPVKFISTNLLPASWKSIAGENMEVVLCFSC
jgi:hypothetical protein